MSNSADTIPALLAAGAAEATAISAPGRAPLTYGLLRAFLAEATQTLRSLGAARNDRIAIVLPNGPEMAVSFLAAASGCTAAPLNPSYRAEEFEFYLSDLAARLLIVEAGKASPAIEVAQRLGVPVVQLTPTLHAPAGTFELAALDGGQPAAARPAAAAEPADIALVLHTSGTTSRPKIVPLSQRNVCASANNVRSTLALTAGRSWPQRDAAVPHPRADRRPPRAPVRGRRGLLHARLRRAAFLPLDGGGSSDVVHRGADHAPDDPGAGGQACAGDPRQPAALHPLFVFRPSAAGDRRAGGDVQCAGGRILRHDRGSPSDGQQPAASGRAQARHGGRGRRARSRDHGHRRQSPGGGHAG